MSEKNHSDETLGPDSLKHLADEVLVRVLVAGNQDAMEIIFDRYYRMVMNIALRIVRDAGEAQDIVQVVFTDFYRQIRLFDSRKGSLRTWLLQYSYGRSINRKEALQSRSFYDQSEFASVDPAAFASSSKVLDLDSPEATRLVEQVLATLSEHQRSVIDMVCFQGFTLAETAAITGESMGNVQHTYFRGIKKLRAYLRDADDQAQRRSQAKHQISLFRGFRKVAKEMKDTGGEIVKARAL
jgi:RNA polymerase sigma-70 factor, ECF subfamily